MKASCCLVISSLTSAGGKHRTTAGSRLPRLSVWRHKCRGRRPSFATFFMKEMRGFCLSVPVQWKSYVRGRGRERGSRNTLLLYLLKGTSILSFCCLTDGETNIHMHMSQIHMNTTYRNCTVHFKVHTSSIEKTALCMLCSSHSDTNIHMELSAALQSAVWWWEVWI